MRRLAHWLAWVRWAWRGPSYRPGTRLLDAESKRIIRERYYEQEPRLSHRKNHPENTEDQ